MKTLRYYASVAAMFTRLSVKSELEYPFMLVGHVLANCIQWVVGFATIKFVVDQFGSIGGWGYESLAFLYGMSVLGHGLAVLLYIQTWYMGYDVIEGEYHRFLVRQMGLVFPFLFSNFNLIRVTEMIPGLIVFVYGCTKVRLALTLQNLLLILCTLAGGTMIRGAVWLFCGSMSFWTRSTANFTDMVGELFERVSMYPLTIYPKWAQTLFTFLLPLAWITFWPVRDMLGPGAFAIPVPLALVTLAVGLLMFAGSCAVYLAGMKRYESAGS